MRTEGCERGSVVLICGEHIYALRSQGGLLVRYVGLVAFSSNRTHQSQTLSNCQRMRCYVTVDRVQIRMPLGAGSRHLTRREVVGEPKTLSGSRKLRKRI
jgi:hypothetical protein